ncbi:hypothetical protein J6S88_00205 [bacterium]|nr:hypothetical protein [bacterium]
MENTVKNILSEFYDVPACVFAKDGLVIAAALGQNAYDAYIKAFDYNPADMFDGTVGFSTAPDEKCQKHIKACKAKLVEIKGDLKDHKKNVINNALSDDNADTENARKLSLTLDKNKFKVATKTVPTSEQIEDAIFAWKVSKYLERESILIAKDFKTVALFQGTNDVEEMVEKALDFGCENTKNSALCISTDELTPHIIHACAQARVGVLIYSGGNIQNTELVKLADKYSLAILITGIRI